MVLTATVGGNGKITTYHPDGKTLVKLAGTVNGGMVKTYQPDGTILVDLSSNDDGGLVNVFNKAGEGIAQLGANAYGNGVVGAYNRKGIGRTLQPGPWHDGGFSIEATSIWPRLRDDYLDAKPINEQPQLVLVPRSMHHRAFLHQQIG